MLKVDEVVRRMKIVEGQLSEKENDFADSRIVCSRIEGMMSAVQGREVQLDANENQHKPKCHDGCSMHSGPEVNEVVGQVTNNP